MPRLFLKDNKISLISSCCKGTTLKISVDDLDPELVHLLHNLSQSRYHSITREGNRIVIEGYDN